MSSLDVLGFSHIASRPLEMTLLLSGELGGLRLSVLLAPCERADLACSLSSDEAIVPGTTSKTI